MAHRNEKASEDWEEVYPGVYNRIKNLLRSREWADCSFQFKTDEETGEVTLIAHKLILATASPVFAAMFYGDVGDKEKPVMIDDIDVPTFTSLLEYIYTDKTVIADAEAAVELYKAAHKYMLDDLEKVCLEVLFKHLDPDNVCFVYEFACLFSERELEKMCLEMFSERTQLVLKGSSFKNASTSTVKKIVSLDDLNVTGEIDIYNALLEYVDNYKNRHYNENPACSFNTENKQDEKETNNEDAYSKFSENVAMNSSLKTIEESRKILRGIIEEIRFLTMTPADLAKICQNNKLLTRDEWLALFSNAFSHNSCLRMPIGFSCIRERRIKGAGTISHTVNVRSIAIGQKVYSSPCYVRKLPWRILVVRPMDNILSFNLECNAEALKLTTMPQDWSCEAKIRLNLHSDDPYINHIESDMQIKRKHKFCQKDNVAVCLVIPDINSVRSGKWDPLNVDVYFWTSPVQGMD
ncbi:BTB/POZ domain-containing protein [Phthorimaea operculella]|nr:BTB/POZ domain-containing protein [Phthorimaea operculella]